MPGGPAFPDDPGAKPLFAPTGLPLVCTTDGEDVCCDPCQAWLDCLIKRRFVVEIDGFSLDGWRGTWAQSLADWKACLDAITGGALALNSSLPDPGALAFAGVYLSSVGGLLLVSPSFLSGTDPTLVFEVGALRAQLVSTLEELSTDEDEHVLDLNLRAVELFLLVACEAEGLRFYLAALGSGASAVSVDTNLGGTPTWASCGNTLVTPYCVIAKSATIPYTSTPADLVDVPLVLDIPGACADYYSGSAGTMGSVTLASKSCGHVPNCQICDPPTPRDVRVKDTPATVEIGVSHTGCSYTLSAVVPECLDVLKIIWKFSDGTTDEGPTVGKLVTWRLPGIGDEREVTATLQVVDVRGCVYEASEVLTCGCACASSGAPYLDSSEYFPASGSYTYCLKATCSGPEECLDGSSIVIQRMGSGGFECWYTTEGVTGPPDECGQCPGGIGLGGGGLSCSGVDEYCVNVADGEQRCFRWAFASSACCLGEWHCFAIVGGVGMVAWDCGQCCRCVDPVASLDAEAVDSTFNPETETTTFEFLFTAHIETCAEGSHLEVCFGGGHSQTGTACFNLADGATLTRFFETFPEGYCYCWKWRFVGADGCTGPWNCADFHYDVGGNPVCECPTEDCV